MGYEKKYEEEEGRVKSRRRWTKKIQKMVEKNGEEEPRNVPSVVHDGVSCSPSGVLPEPLPDFTSIYKHFGGAKIE